VELSVSKLPVDADAATLQQIAGSKIVVNASVKEGKKGTCAGTGRVTVRLNQGETSE